MRSAWGIAVPNEGLGSHAERISPRSPELLAGTCNLEAWSLKRFFEIDLLLRSKEIPAQFDERFCAPARPGGGFPARGGAPATASPHCRPCSDLGSPEPPPLSA